MTDYVRENLHVTGGDPADLRPKACIRCGSIHRFMTRKCLPIVASDDWPGDLEWLLTVPGAGRLVAKPDDLVETTTCQANGQHIDHSGREIEIAAKVAEHPEVVMTPALRRFLRLQETSS